MVLRWGIISAGKISHDFVTAFNSYPEKGDQIIFGVAARDQKRAAEFAKLHNLPKTFDSYQSMVTSKEIDVVYIGALNREHYQLTKLCLENGKHVLCEKPLCMNEKQVQSLVNLSKKNNKFLMEAVWSTFFPAYKELEREINSGKLGEVSFLDVNFGQSIINVDRLSKKELGGSALMDIGIYTLHLAQYVFKDEPIKIIANGELNDEGVDTVSTIILEYTRGRRAVLNIHSKLRLWNKATVYGSKGRATLSDPFHCTEEYIRSDGKSAKFPLHQSKLNYNFENSAGLVYEAIEVKRCIEQGLIESPRMTHKDSLILAKLEDEIRRQLGVHYEEDNQKF